MKITQEENDLLLQLVKEMSMPVYDPVKYVTPIALADSLECTVNKSRHILENKLKSGDLKKIKVRLPSGHWSWGYYKD